MTTLTEAIALVGHRKEVTAQNYRCVPDCPRCVLDRAYEDREREQEILKELRAWKESAIAVMPDFQAIGEELGIRLGDSVHDKILPAIRKMKQDRERAIQEAVAGAYKDAAEYVNSADDRESCARGLLERGPTDAQAALDSLIEAAIEAGREYGEDCAEARLCLQRPPWRPTSASIREGRADA